MEGNLFPQFPTTESGPAEPTVDAEKFRAMSLKPRAMHEKWLDDWRSELERHGAMVMKRVESEQAARADQWREQTVKQSFFSFWKTAVNIAWSDERAAMTMWRALSLSRTIRKWKKFVAKRKRKMDLDLASWQYSRAALARRTFTRMRSHVEAITSRRNQIHSVTVARILILKCRWSLVKWKKFAERNRIFKKKIGEKAKHRALCQWKEYVIRKKSRRRLHLLSIGLSRNQALATSLNTWCQSLRLRKEMQSRIQQARRQLARRRLQNSMMNWINFMKIRARRKQQALKMQEAMLHWYGKVVSSTLELWHGRMCESIQQVDKIDIRVLDPKSKANDNNDSAGKGDDDGMFSCVVVSMK
mmetsp:Transcript_30892/g.54200  ORF Transcript_30892/g.54200 Transcript_30892/m.54200 type:complete len:358 (+) Transcript_30892:98-1171(+)